MASKIIRTGTQQVRPILSSNRDEARRRVLNLYKAWYRQIPFVVQKYDIPVTIPMGQAKLREYFQRNKHVSDIRTIDILVVKGQMDLVEVVNIWSQRNHIMDYFKPTVNEKPKGFLSKFYAGGS